jgi:hypothetical protein
MISYLGYLGDTSRAEAELVDAKFLNADLQDGRRKIEAFGRSVRTRNPTARSAQRCLNNLALVRSKPLAGAMCTNLKM